MHFQRRRTFALCYGLRVVCFSPSSYPQLSILQGIHPLLEMVETLLHILLQLPRFYLLTATRPSGVDSEMVFHSTGTLWLLRIS